MTTQAPNISELVGADVARRMIAAAGGLVALATLNHSALRHVGMNDILAEGDGGPGRAAPTAEMRYRALRARQVQAGYILDAPVLTASFGAADSGAFGESFDGVDISELTAIKKAVAVLGRKCAILVKIDVSGGSADGSMGVQERERLEQVFEGLLAEGKVTEADQRALPIPEVFDRRVVKDPKKQRGGQKERRKREAQKEVPSTLEKTFSHVRMGISEEEQREQNLQRADVRASALSLTKNLATEKNRKRGRNSSPDASSTANEYDDLAGLRL